MKFINKIEIIYFETSTIGNPFRISEISRFSFKLMHRSTAFKMNNCIKKSSKCFLYNSTHSIKSESMIYIFK